MCACCRHATRAVGEVLYLPVVRIRPEFPSGLQALILQSASRVLFPVRTSNKARGLENPKSNSQAPLPRCSRRLAVVPRPHYAKDSPAQARPARLLQQLRDVHMTSDSAQQPALAIEQDSEQSNASVLGFNQVDRAWTHPKYKPELVQAVMEYLVEEC